MNTRCEMNFFSKLIFYCFMDKLKTRQEVANELGISAKTLNRRIKDATLTISSGLLTIKEQKMILALFSEVSALAN